MGLRVLYLGISDNAEIFFFYFFALSPGGVAVFVLAEPDVAEVVFGVRDNDDDLAGSGVFVNSSRYFPEALAKVRRGVPELRPLRWGRRSCIF